MRELVHSGRFALLLAALITAALGHVSSQPQTPARADTVWFRIIVVESQDAAIKVTDALKSGENVVALAARVSIDPSAANGGLVGPAAAADLRPEIRSALDRLRVGEVSGVVRLPTGFGILKRVADVEAVTGDPSPASGAATVMASGVTPALGSAGSVKYVYDLSGYVETVLSLRQAALPPDAVDDLGTLCQVRRQIVSRAQTLVADALTPARAAGMAPIDRAQARVLEGQLHAFRGEMAPAIRALEDAHRIAVAQVPDLRLQLLEALGIAHLHKAEIDNGVYEHPGDRCLLPARPGSRLANVADVSKAIEYFAGYLAEQPDELEVRWLLNIAHMYAGTFPGGVPGAQLIPPGAFESSEDVRRFVDVAPRAGLQSVSLSGGVIVDDFDRDGRLDIVTSSIDSCAPLRLFHRNEDGTFTDRAAPAGLGAQLGGLNIVQTDYNNDGNLDILVLRGGWETPQRKSLLRNNGDGTFSDVTVASGLGTGPTGTQAAVWTDVDNDGFLDLFVGNENGPAQLFHNNRNGTFDDMAEKAGVARRGFNKGVAAADYDNDGWPDLYASNLGGTNFLYRNNRNGTFSEFGRGAGAPGPGQGFPTWFFDYDNDGFQDLFVGSFVTSLDEAARAYLRLPHNGNTLKLYHNLGDGSFEDVTRQAGLDKVLMVMGANFGDIDNDGFLDMYLGTGNPSYASLVPSLLLRNKGGKSFVDVTASSGTGELHKGHGVAFADLDHDGDQEIVFEVGGATPGDAHALRLFENPGHGRDWIALDLVGVKTNRAAIGARITVTVEGEGGRRVLHRSVGSGGSFGASPLQQEIGLGTGAQRVDVEIWWPTSNSRQRFSNVGKNRFLEITEFAPAPKALQRPLLRLGRP
ncbi:MAG TPA: FG-GAP-like repeat-containing protein [Vicinamibacterales bacterium]|nr:FG-GAP-like repeat-containing protein [Vicinamibacterales bacterium]